MKFGSGLWHRFVKEDGKRSQVFEITASGLNIYFRTGLVGAKLSTKRLTFATEDEAEKAANKLIDERLADGFAHQRSVM